MLGDELTGATRDNEPKGCELKKEDATLNLTCTFVVRECAGITGDEDEAGGDGWVSTARSLHRGSGDVEVRLV